MAAVMPPTSTTASHDSPSGLSPPSGAAGPVVEASRSGDAPPVFVESLGISLPRQVIFADLRVACSEAYRSRSLLTRLLQHRDSTTVVVLTIYGRAAKQNSVVSRAHPEAMQGQRSMSRANG